MKKVLLLLVCVCFITPHLIGEPEDFQLGVGLMRDGMYCLLYTSPSPRD